MDTILFLEVNGHTDKILQTLTDKLQRIGIGVDRGEVSLDGLLFEGFHVDFVVSIEFPER